MEEPNAFIRWTVYIFAGGGGAIFGACCLTAVVILVLCRVGRRPVRPLLIGAIITISLMLIACGSLVVPGWFQCLTGVWVLLVLSPFRLRGFKIERTEKSKSVASRKMYFACSSAWLVTLLALELPHLFWVAPPGSISNLLVIADSVTAGLNDREDTWPRQLARVADIELFDASQPGATLRSARQQNRLLSRMTGTLILEIGGNDLLEGLPVSQFERDLDQLLSDAVQPGRSVVLFELPLPPLCAAYGLAQRRQVAKHGVRLIPKRLFASIISTRGATVDGIHLSHDGQTLMMKLIRSLLSSGLRAGQGHYHHLDPR